MEIETLRSIAATRPEPVLNVDLARIEKVDASGLGLLVELQNWASVTGRSLRFTNASDFVARLVVLTRLHCVLVFPVNFEHESCKEAAAALSA